jgi:glycosyltransferase involved in cell wall biosynthesis
MAGMFMHRVIQLAGSSCTHGLQKKKRMPEAMMQPPVTLMIMIYNQARFITDAVQSAFSQTYDGPLEILLSDDASTDGTTEILQSLVAQYDGPFRVRLNVNRRNLGLMAHFNKVFALASHDFVVCGAGDDISRNDRVAHLARIQAETGAWLLYSRTEFMNSAGKMLPDPGIATTFATDWTLPDVARSNALFIGAGSAYHKDVLRSFGPIIEKHAFEDLVLGFRAALCGRIAYCDEPLVQYRLGEGLSRAGRTSFQERTQALTVWIAVLRQRLTDAKGFGLAFGDPIMETLRDTLSQAEFALVDHLKAGAIAQRA